MRSLALASGQARTLRSGSSREICDVTTGGISQIVFTQSGRA